MYQIKKKGKTQNEHVIEKKYEHVVTFTMEDIEAHERLLEKALKELDTQLKLESAKRDNIRNNNKWINNMTPEKVHACYMFHSSVAAIAQYNPKIKEIKKQLKEYKAEKAQIKEALGFEDEKS